MMVINLPVYLFNYIKIFSPDTMRCSAFMLLLNCKYVPYLTYKFTFLRPPYGVVFYLSILSNVVILYVSSIRQTLMCLSFLLVRKIIRIVSLFIDIYYFEIKTEDKNLLMRLKSIFYSVTKYVKIFIV